MLEQTTGEQPPFPPIKVVRGNPTPEELAAAVAVVRARAATAAAEAPTARHTEEWNDPTRLVARRLPHPGPKAWRTTYWPL